VYVPVHFVCVGVLGAVVVSLTAAVAVGGNGFVLDSAADDHGYRWVDPPAIHAPHNVPPQGRAAEAAPGVETFWTPDLQVQLRWTERREPVPVAVEVLPLSAGALASLPEGAQAAGNAYRIGFEPRRVVGGIVVHLRVPGDVDRVYVTDGVSRRWRSVRFEREDPGIITFDWEGNGTVLAATLDEPMPVSVVASAAVGAAAALLTAAVVLRRRSRSTT
jgi:hypothetical protein